MQTIFGSASISGLAARVMAAAALAFAVTSLASLAVEPARADVISVFTVSAEFRGPFQLSGTFTLDSTTGDVTASNLSLSTIAVTRITEVVSTEPGEPNPATTRFKGQNNSNTASLVLVFPVVNLVGYQGGDLSTLSFFSPRRTTSSLCSTGRRRSLLWRPCLSLRHGRCCSPASAGLRFSVSERPEGGRLHSESSRDRG